MGFNSLELGLPGAFAPAGRQSRALDTLSSHYRKSDVVRSAHKQLEQHGLREVAGTLQFSLFQRPFFLLDDEAFRLCNKPAAFFHQLSGDALGCVANDTHQNAKTDALLL